MYGTHTRPSLRKNSTLCSSRRITTVFKRFTYSPITSSLPSAAPAPPTRRTGSIERRISLTRLLENTQYTVCSFRRFWMRMVIVCNTCMTTCSSSALASSTSPKYFTIERERNSSTMALASSSVDASELPSVR